MNVSTGFRLSTMTFLNFFSWGAWFVTLGTYLKSIPGVTDVQVGIAFGTQSLGAIIAPFIVGLMSDCFLAAQEILAILHLAGATTLYYISTVNSFSAFYPALLIYMILFMPTLALINSVSFNQVHDPEKDFARTRVWRTIGWIVAGLIIGWLAWEQNNSLVNTFRLAAVVSLIIGIFSFTLPNTPPTRAGTTVTIGEIPGVKAIGLLKDRSFFIFFLASLLICVPFAFYYQETNIFLNELKVEGATGKMAFGQMSEMIFMILMPLLFTRLGVKKMLLIGMGAWVVRHLCFAYGNIGSATWMLYTGIILHGVCYDFFFVTGQGYTNEKAGEKIRSSARGMITLATYGVGMLTGSWVTGVFSEKYTITNNHDWKSIWTMPALPWLYFFCMPCCSGKRKRKVLYQLLRQKRRWPPIHYKDILTTTMSRHKTTRRKVFKNLLLGGTAVIASPAITMASRPKANKEAMLKGNINHSVCWWTYNFISLDQLCTHVKEIGFAAIDLVGPKDWATLKKHNVYSSMCNGAEISLTEGWNDKQYHSTLIKNYTDHIELVSKAGYKNLICFSGNRKGMDDETGLKNCVDGLKQILAIAEKKDVIIQMELLNSKVNHKDYMCDKSAWGVELCKRLGSENFKLLYDIYHMQIDEGDVIRTIQDNHKYFGHYHTGGVPGRHEIDESQELYYPAIIRAVKETGFKGYLAQEFIPAKQDKIASLREAIKVCDV